MSWFGRMLGRRDDLAAASRERMSAEIERTYAGRDVASVVEQAQHIYQQIERAADEPAPLVSMMQVAHELDGSSPDDWTPDGGPLPDHVRRSFCPPPQPRIIQMTDHESQMPGYALPTVFATTKAKEKYEDDLAADHAAQLVRWQVARGCSVDTLTRGKLTAGEPLIPTDIAGGRRSLERLVDLHVVSAISEAEVRARNPDYGDGTWTHRVAPGKSTISRRRGVLEPGMTVAAVDFAEPAEPATEASPGRIRTDGSVEPARAAFPGRAGTDGAKEIAYLVERGILVPRDPATLPAPKARVRPHVVPAP